jgi:5'-nucleotidase
MVEAFNAAQLDYATFGNHEFELPLDTLEARIGGSNFKWLSSNCSRADGTPFPKVLPWDTVRVYGQKIGLFGLTLQGNYRREYRCADPDSAAHRAIDTLGALGADLIVGLTHQAAAQDHDLLARESKLDLILGGHEHEAQDSIVSGRHVLKADANSRTAQFATLWGGKEHWRTAVGLVTIDGRLPDDSLVKPVVDRWQDSLRVRLGPERAIGRTSAPIDARDAVSRRQESALGDLVTDAIRAGTRADVALINAGTLRLDDVIQAGPVSNYQLESIFLFADETRVPIFTLTGERLRQVLEHGVAAAGRGGFLQVSGVSFTYDPAAAEGARIRGELLGPAGRPIAARDSLRVAFPVYPACHGGDGYQVPEAAGSCQSVASAPRAVDLLIRYITDSLHGEIGVPSTGRITRTGNTNPG